jgi:ATP-dependent protease ClpP protease subunit
MQRHSGEIQLIVKGLALSVAQIIHTIVNFYCFPPVKTIIMHYAEFGL